MRYLHFVLFLVLLSLSSMSCGRGASSVGVPSSGGGMDLSKRENNLLLTSSSGITSQVDWIKSRFGGFGLVDSYQGDTQGEVGWTYDQAMAILSFSRAGFSNSVYFNDARRLISAMQRLQNSDGSWYFAYDVRTGSPHDATLYTGQIAWMVVALGHYQYWSGDAQFRLMMDRAVAWLLAQMDRNQSNETHGALTMGPQSSLYSTENNMDAYLALLWAGKTAEAGLIRDYLFREMWAPATTSNGRHDLNVFWTGYQDFTLYTDNQTLANIIFGPIGPGGEPVYRAFDTVRANMWNQQDFSDAVKSVGGVSIHVDDPNVVWCEGTGQYELAARYIAAYADASYLSIAEEAHREMQRVIQSDGGIPFSFSSPAGRSAVYPNHYPYSYIASAAWHYFNE